MILNILFHPSLQDVPFILDVNLGAISRLETISVQSLGENTSGMEIVCKVRLTSTHMLFCSTCSKHPPTTIELSVSVWTESVYRGDYCLIQEQCISVCLEIVIISSTGSSCLMISFQYSVLGLWFCVACQWTTALCSNCRSIWKQVMDICR